MAEDRRLERLRGQAYLKSVRFERKPNRAYSASWDHDHCAGCWVKFVKGGTAPGNDLLHEGYATTEDYLHGAEHVWVCGECFALFRRPMSRIEAYPDD